MLRKHFPWMTAEEEIRLRSELMRRAALGFEQAELWRDAAECWAALGEHARAGELYARSEDLGAAASALLEAGRYARAIELYRRWEASLLEGDVINRIRALLGQAACHLLGASQEQTAKGLSRPAGQQTYRRARTLMETEARRDDWTAARCYAALGEYGARLNRFDLAQQGYERALVRFDGTRERIEATQAYLDAARAHGDHVLAQSLEERLAEWDDQAKLSQSRIRQEQAKPSRPGIRQPICAGTWYPADPSKLESEVQRLLNAASPDPSIDGLIGLTASHSGLVYSGHVSAAGFARLKPGMYDTVVVLGPNHRLATRGKVLTLDVDAWRTPLGDIPVAWDILEALQSEIDLELLSTDSDQSIEAVLPFLQVALKEFRLVPLMVNDHSLDTCRQLSATLVNAIRIQGGHSPTLGGQAENTLFVASSDVSHVLGEATARRLDEVILPLILDLDADGFLQAEETLTAAVDGRACIATVIYAARMLGATRDHLLGHATSADVTGVRNGQYVISYASVAISK